MSRPTILTEERAQRIIEATLLGVHTEVAAQMAGIAHSTYFLWQAKGKRDLEQRAEGDFPSIDDSHKHEWPNSNDGACWCGHTRYSEFVERLKVAEARSEVTAVMKVRSAFDADWKAAMTYLERRYPQRWSRRDRLAVSATDIEDESTEVQEEPMVTRIAKTLAILEGAGRLNDSDGSSSD